MVQAAPTLPFLGDLIMRFESVTKPAIRARLLAIAQRRTRPPLALGVLIAVLCIAAGTSLAYLFTGIAPVQAVSIVYLPGMVVVASAWGPSLGLVMALASAATIDYFFLPSAGSSDVTDFAVLVVFLIVAVLTCGFSALMRSLAVEIDARRDAGLAADLARLLLCGPDPRTALPAAAQRLQRALGLQSASIELGAIQADPQQEAFPLRNGVRLGTLIVPARLPKPTLRRLRDRVLPSLEVLLYAAEERERNAEALKASRDRIVAATDATRRRLERDLHDGTQQRLITMLLKIRVLQDAPPRQPDVLQQELAQMAGALDETLTDLQEISRGLHPAILAKRGIQPALAALARRCPITVNLNLSTRRRLSERLETTIYYITSEALTNVAKHAHASEVDIDLDSDASVRLAIRDNGIGGADPARGSGLTGLADRVEALDGTIKIVSPAGGGTELLIELPACSS
ncbi:MAG TPA: histidine kinase [Kribbella sp.]